MRFVATMLLWLVTTVLLAAAVPAAWAQQHLVDEGGFAALAQKAAGTTQLQDAMANEIGAQLKAVVAGSGYDLPTGQLVGAASIYTGSSSFPGQFAQANYSASKAGDIGFSRALAQEGARNNVTVNVVAPGYIATDMVMAVPEKVREAIIAQIPVGRLGEATEIARAVVFLASDEAGFITGSTISANGGQFFS